ncbi:TonB-dependent siderophore receptor [Nostoc parmelioides]|uniref:TonB-dependent siderophore receptor n=1 Tax=Nostoc parmelioides FACHB-3921 TaxID=2692909 RepID=A0ABR8BI16_9NOSO|nr:TonB-dependent siderophore receptor [Nostoc parmelioides]MBD2253339.1 TonB-dependent siderophore receptor [Nostoc parmelioides FACHB-3921]
MRGWCLSVRLSFLISVSGCLSIVAVSSVLASEKQQDVDTQHQTSFQIRQPSKIELPTTNAQLLVQSPTPSNSPAVSGSIVTITGVKANPTDKGVEIILETTLGEQLQVSNRSAENNFIADIPNAQLRLSSGEAFTFRSEKPVNGITEITVTNIDANTVRVTVVGVAALPTVELFDDDAGLVFAVTSTTTATKPPQTPPTEEQPASETPTAQQDDPIELVVTGERDSYRVPNASTATRTDTPLRDIPQSIQVVPQEVLRDRSVRTLTQAVETVSGVTLSSSYSGSVGTVGGFRTIRGFVQGGSFRNGLNGDPGIGVNPIGTIEQVEVLKGPASVLFGALEPGGVINTITRQPLAEPYYRLGFEAGNFGRYQPSVDLSGPLTTDRSILYRFIAAYDGGEGFQDYTNSQTTTIAPSLTFKIGDRTNLNIYYEYARYYANPSSSYTALLGDGSLPPRSFYPSYGTSLESESQRFGYALNHAFNDNWQVRNNLAINFTNFSNREIYYLGILDDRFLSGFENFAADDSISTYSGQIDLLGKFKTGSISHQLLAGFDFNRRVQYFGQLQESTSLPDLDIFNPNYDVTVPDFLIPVFTNQDITQSYGVYLQDQIAFSDNLKLLIGGRYDWISSSGFRLIDSDDPSQNDGAFSPRIGLVYQPSENISLYTSYSQSFRPAVGRNPDNRAFEPTRGTQYEVGIKTDFLDGRLSTTLAAYNLTKTNVLTPDPDPVLALQGFQVQVGEQRSRGIELDVAGEVLPGWRIVASYALTDAEVTADNSTPSRIGNRLEMVPQHQASLWTTYTIQGGDLQGLGFGLGLFYVGERQGNLDNSFQLGDYLRTDAALFYRRDRFNAAINVRNLFNTDYLSATIGEIYNFRGEPFTITGSVSWEF